MNRLAVALGAAAALAAGAGWWLRAPTAVVTPAQEPPRVLARAQPTPASPLPDSPVSRKVDELRTMSESVRNSTFVIAIRAAGFMCEDVVNVYASTEVPSWRARCPDNRAYYVRVADAGELVVEPTLDYFDSVAPRPLEGRDPPDGRPTPLTPRR